MDTLIVIYHSGMVITNEIGSYEFVGIKKDTFLLNELVDNPVQCYGISKYLFT
jgi:hypothetical protein